MKFPVFVRSSKERDLPQRADQKSLVEVFREKYVSTTDVQRCDQEAHHVDERPAVVLRSVASVGMLPQAFSDALETVESVSVQPSHSTCPIMLTSQFRLGEASDVFRDGLRPMQQYAAGALASGSHCTLVGPKGTGKRSIAWFFAGATALQAKKREKEAPVGPWSVIITSTNSEAKTAHRFLSKTFGPLLRLPDTRKPFDATAPLEGDVWIGSLFSWCDLMESARGGRELNLDGTVLMIVNGIERLLLQPLCDRLTSEMWDFSRSLCHSTVRTVAIGSIPSRALEAAAMVHHRIAADDVTIVQVQDSTAWAEVFHDVAYVPETMVTDFLSELLTPDKGTLSLELPAIIVVQGKQDVQRLLNELGARRIRVTDDYRAFSEGDGDVLLLTDWTIGEGISIPSAVGLVINYSLPKRDMEDVLSWRARSLFSTKAREFVGHMITIVNGASCPTPVAGRLKRFLMATRQHVPHFLSQLQ